MRAFFHPDQSLHDPKQFMRVGKISDPQDVPARTEKLLKGLAAAAVTVEAPEDAGLEPVRKVHNPGYLEFLETAYGRWRMIESAGPEVLPNVSPYWNGSPDHDFRQACRPNSIVAQAGFYLGDLAVPIGENTWRSCIKSTHSAVAAANAVIAGDRFAYALCRPSGHHARADRA
ncbi:MAG: histone deacetylase family protein, partial [Hyphomicrobiales bacterium]